MNMFARAPAGPPPPIREPVAASLRNLNASVTARVALEGRYKTYVAARLQTLIDAIPLADGLPAEELQAIARAIDAEIATLRTEGHISNSDASTNGAVQSLLTALPSLRRAPPPASSGGWTPKPTKRRRKKRKTRRSTF